MCLHTSPNSNDTFFTQANRLSDNGDELCKLECGDEAGNEKLQISNTNNLSSSRSIRSLVDVA